MFNLNQINGYLHIYLQWTAFNRFLLYAHQ